MRLKIALIAACIAAGITQVLGQTGIAQDHDPYGFISNSGQVRDQNGNLNSEVKYMLLRPGMNVQVKNGGFSYDTYVKERSVKWNPKSAKAADRTPGEVKYHRVDITFPGANPATDVVALGRAEDRVHYISQSEITAAHYESILYRNIYDGIDLKLYFNAAGSFEYDFIVNPGANPNLIRMNFMGQNDLTQAGEQTLSLALAHGELREEIPASYIRSTKQAVNVKYRLADDSNVSFEVGNYDKSQVLVIDPSPSLVWASYYGGTLEDSGESVSADASDNIYYAGYSESTNGSNIIATSGAHQTSVQGLYDAFVVKFNSAGVRQFGTYFGGTGEDFFEGVLADASGNIYATGHSQSSGLATSGTAQVTFGGSRDVILLKLSSTGTRLWSTYFGGTGDDRAFDITLDGASNPVVGGRTSTSGMTMSSGWQTTFGGGTNDGLIVAFNASNGTKVVSSYVGGSGNDGGVKLICDGSSNVYFVGWTNSTDGIASAAHQSTIGGGYDAFAVKFGSTGTKAWGTYYGGSSDDEGYGIGLDGSGNVYITGYTTSTTGIATAGTHQTSYTAGGTNGEDGFIAKFNSGGVRQWGTYYGGAQDDILWSLVGNNSYVFVTGETESTTGISTAGSQQPTSGGFADAMLAKFNSSNGTIQWGSYFGGSDTDGARYNTVDGSGNFIIAGYTFSTSGISSAGSHQSSLGGDADGFLAKFQDGSVATAPTISSFSPTSASVDTFITINGTGFSTTASQNVVFFGATKATPQTASATQLSVQVPAGASYQPITVTVNGLTAYSKGSFMPVFSGSGSINASTFSTPFSVTGAGTESNHTVIQDIDLDGKSDVLVAANGNLSIYRNISTGGSLSGASFAAKVDFAFPGTGGNHIISTGDLDGDGKTDIMVAANNVASIFRNNSTSGTINTGSLVKTDLTTSDARSGAIFDFDGDGKPDLALVEYTANTVKVFRNTNSTGSIVAANFGSPVVLTAATAPHGIAVGDIDGDGKPDLVVTNQGTSNMSVFRNLSTSGSISFAAKVDFAAGSAPLNIAVGDLDADAKLDVIVANATGGTVSFFRNTATSGTITSGSFAAKVDLTGGSNTLGLAISDIDGDGKPDILAGSQGLGVSVFKNNGSGTFAAKVDFSAGVNPNFGLAVADLNADQRPDVAVANNTPNTVTFLQNATTIVVPPPTITSFTPASGAVGSSVTINGTNFSGTNSIVYFGATKATVTSGSTTQLTVTVPNGNSFMPVSVTNSGGLTAYTAKPFIVTISGAASLSSTSFLTKQDISTGTSSFPDGLVTGDFDGDGKPDVAVATANAAGNTVNVFKNNSTIGTVSLTSVLTPTAGTSPMGPVVADWDGDGKLDLIVSNPTSNNVSIFRNTSTSSISFATKVDFAGSNVRVLAVGDIDGDGRPDLAISNTSTNNVTVYRNTGTVGTILASLVTTYTTGTSPYGVALADVTGDGLIDLIVANGGANTVSVLRNTSTSGSISFVAKVDFVTNTQPQMLAIADYDQDGKLDIAVTCPSANVVSVLRNTTSVVTTPSFATKVDLIAGIQPTGIATDDIDGDGKPDIAAGNVTNPGSVSVFKNNSASGGITFSTKFDFTVGGNPHYVMSITDIDGDGKKDILITNSASDTYSVLRNNITVTASEPADQPTAFSASGQTSSSVTISFTAAASNPSGYFVLRGTGVIPNTDPVDNTAYTVGGAYGNATIVAIGSATSLSQTGLTAGTTYNYKIYSYNGSGSNINFRVVSPLQGNATTLANLATEPTAQPTNLQTSNATNSSLTVSFTVAAGSPAGYIVVRGPAGGAAPTFVPVDGTEYSTGPVSSDAVANTGSASTFNDTGLAANTTYSYRAYSYNGSGSTINYLTTSPASGTGATNNTPPTVPTAFGTVTTSNFSDLYTVRFSSATTVFAGGDGGTMLRSDDGGTNWSTVTVPTSSAIWGLYFTSSTNGIAVGSDGLIMRTTNGGTTWTLVTNPATEALYAVQMVPGTTVGYTAGDQGYAYKTTDGGATWTQLVNAPSQSGSYYNTIYFKSATEGLMAGPGGVVRTTDGGANWTTFSSDKILWYTFPTASVGYGVGSNGKIIKSTDGGATWTTQTSGVSSTLWNAYFVDSSIGFAVGADGVILKTSNGGTAWSAALEATDEIVYSIHFGSNANGVVVGGAGYIAKAENEPSALSITLQPKSTINYGGTETVAITIPVADVQNRVLNVNFVVIGIVEDAAGGSPIITPLTPTGGVYTGTITSKTDATGDKVGFKYRFEVEYDEQFASFKSTADSYIYVKYTDANKLKLTNLKVAPVGTADANNYQLISIPLQLENASASTIFGTPNKKEWRLFASAPKGTTETTYTEANSVALGKGYWLITTKASTVELGTGTAFNATASNPFKLSLAAGYNLIGNPYNFNVGWTAGTAVKELRTFFNGAWTSSSTLEPFKGYFVDVETAGSYDVPLTGNFNSRTRGMLIEQNESSWELKLVIEQGGLRNEMGKIGMHPDATLGYDAIDERVFPMPGFFNLASLSVHRPEAGRDLEHDYVPTSENQVWDFTLKAAGESRPVTLSWDRESIASIGRDLYLFDEEAIALIDMHTVNTYQTRTNMPLKIITGNPIFVRSQLTFGESRIGNLYPNPASQGFFVPVAMPKAGEVNVRVFDMKGAEIASQRHFVNEGMQHISVSGLPEGMNGLYLVTTETGEGRRVQRVIFK